MPCAPKPAFLSIPTASKIKTPTGLSFSAVISTRTANCSTRTATASITTVSRAMNMTILLMPATMLLLSRRPTTSPPVSHFRPISSSNPAKAPQPDSPESGFSCSNNTTFVQFRYCLSPQYSPNPSKLFIKISSNPPKK